MKLFLQSMIAAMTIGVPSASLAADCSDGLTPNLVSSDFTESQSLAFLWLSSEEQFEERKSRNGGKLGIPDFLDIEFSSDKSRSVRRSKLEKLGYTLDESASWSYFASTIPDSARSDFFECEQIKNERRPFFLDMLDRGVQAEGVRTIEMTLTRIATQGEPPSTLSLEWVVSGTNAELANSLQSILNSNYDSLSAANVSIPIAISIPEDESLSISLFRVGFWGNYVTGVSAFVPTVPMITAEVPSPWLTNIYSVPLAIRIHQDNVGDSWRTVNYNPDTVSSSDTGNLVSGPVLTNVTQEIQIAFDRKARSGGLPVELTDEELGFEYRCTYNAFKLGLSGGKAIDYPSADGWLPMGETCGRQYGSALGGEPRLIKLAVRLTGTKASMFRIKLSCRVGAAWVDVVPESGCATSDIQYGLQGVDLQIDSLGKAD